MHTLQSEVSVGKAPVTLGSKPTVPSAPLSAMRSERQPSVSAASGVPTPPAAAAATKDARKAVPKAYVSSLFVLWCAQ